MYKKLQKLAIDDEDPRPPVGLDASWPLTLNAGRAILGLLTGSIEGMQRAFRERLKRGRSVVCVFATLPSVTMRLKRPDGLSIIASHRMKPEMSSYDPAELLRLCNSIIEDGELTYEELYELAEWLNSHREACAQWPGNVLVEPLQNAWADGKITKTESRQLSRLLLQVRKEAAKREADQLTGQAIQIASRTAETFDLPARSSPPFRSRPASSHTQQGPFSTRSISASQPAPVPTSGLSAVDCLEAI